MSEARQRADWTIGSVMMALIHAVFRTQCARPPKAMMPEDFNPYLKRTTQKMSLSQLAPLMKAAFVKKKK